MAKMRVMHYVNQFFAGIGGEDKADVPAGSIEGAVGPGKRLQEKLGDNAIVVVTAYCGDNYFSENTDESLESILKIAREYKIDLLVAGPAFDSGRHGFACAQVCHTVSSALGLYCVSAMYPENPGIVTYKQYKDEKVFAFPTTAILSSMEDALSKMAQCVLKLAAGSTMGLPSVEGYIPRGIRRDMTVSKNGIDRAVAMLLDKIAGRPFLTEIPVERLEMVLAAPRLINLRSATIALGTTTGVVPKGNPDGFLGQRNNQWKKYSISNLDTMKDGWDVMHAGYNNVFMKDNPNFGVPLDAARIMEKEGVFGKLYPYYYTTTGNVASIPVMQRLGQEMAADMKAEGVDAVLLTSAWGTCNRSGATIVKEIERAGIPVAHITAIPTLSKQLGANRIISGTKIPHPVGDPNQPEENDLALRRKILETALEAIQTQVDGPTVFTPHISFTSG